MKNQITFLGTSHGDPTLTRFCSSTLYQLGETHFLIDAGEPVTGLLVRQEVKPCLLDAVFMTHMHVDHIGGLPALVHYIMKYPDPQRKTELLFPEKEGMIHFRNWMDAMKAYIRPEQVFYTALEPDSCWQCKGVKVSCIPTEHIKSINAPSYAYMIETEDCRILHTGDLAADFHDFPKLNPEKPVDICICEATHIHNRLDQFIEDIKGQPIRKLVFNHIGPLWTDGKEKALEDAAAVLPFPVVVARDGTKIDF